MELSEFVLEHSSELFFPIIPREESEQIGKGGLKFNTYIGCDEIMQFIDDELIQSYSAENAFDLRIELRKLYNLMYSSNIDALPFVCFVRPFDVARVTIEKKYVSDIESDLNGDNQKIEFIGRLLNFFSSHITSDLNKLQRRWYENKPFKP